MVNTKSYNDSSPKAIITNNYNCQSPKIAMIHSKNYLKIDIATQQEFTTIGIIDNYSKKILLKSNLNRHIS